MIKIKRAVLSVYDKTGILEFAKALDRLGVDLISTGGTAELLKKEGISVREVSDVTQFPEMLSGRVKTLHPRLHGGILALRDEPVHMKTLKEHQIEAIDLLVVNLYPFGEAMRTKTDEKEIIEMIDIGGPSMLRSAAKNFRFVAAVSDPSDYGAVLEELQRTEGFLSEATCRQLAGKVFKLTASYESLIWEYFQRQPKSVAAVAAGLMPDTLKLDFRKSADLRYGENPHQKGSVYEQKDSSGGIVHAQKLHGKELSFNNYLDLDAAWEIVADFKEPACAIMKHTNPCGFAIGSTLQEAFKRAYACDPLSAFGGIIGFNGKVDALTSKAISKSGFVECIVATEYTSEALEILTQKKNLRLLTMEPSSNRQGGFDFKKVSGGLLLQERDNKDPLPEELKFVTKLKPKKSQIPDLLFAFKVSRYLKSNAIVIAKKGATLGLGMGQTSRVDSAETAFRKAGKKARTAVLASDGFFPKPDSIALAKKYGISAIIQPGGSIQDEAVIEACNRAKISMVFSGVRHFKH